MGPCRLESFERPGEASGFNFDVVGSILGIYGMIWEALLAKLGSFWELCGFICILLGSSGGYFRNPGGLLLTLRKNTIREIHIDSYTHLCTYTDSYIEIYIFTCIHVFCGLCPAFVFGGSCFGVRFRFLFRLGS